MANHEAAKPVIEIENAPAEFKSIVWKYWGFVKESQLLSVMFVEHVKNAKKYDGQTTNISVMYLNTCSGLVYGTINDFH